MANLNQCNFIGNLTKPPELRYTPSGVAVCNFSIAVNEKWKDKDGQQQERTEYVNVVVWKNLAEICAKYLDTGKPVFITGKMQTRSYEDKNGGSKRYATEIVADQMQMLGQRGDSGGQQQQPSNQQNNQQGGYQQQGGYNGPQYQHGPSCDCPECQIPF